MSIERLLADKPQLHTWSSGAAASWAVSPDVLTFLHSRLKPGMVTLETGSGHTTVVFAIARTRHTCITPAENEAQAIRAYCAKIGIEPQVRFIHASSDAALADPATVQEPLDLVFIDGAHRFPLPCIDFHYTERHLKVGGLLGVDDCTMPSVKVLCDFLEGEDEWKQVERIGNTAFYERVRETRIVSDWQGQKMNRSAPSGARSRLRRLLGRAGRALGR